MAGVWAEDYISAKYHLAVAERMLKSYGDFEDKRFLVGVINEAARAVSGIIRAYLIRGGKVRGSAPENLKVFLNEVAPKFMDEVTRINLARVLEVQKAHKTSPVEFAKKGDIILLIDGKYRFLTIERIRELLLSVKTAVSRFSE
jgi:hypothetical protein